MLVQPTSCSVESNKVDMESQYENGLFSSSLSEIFSKNCTLQRCFLTAIDERHQGTYDFIYLPIDFKNKCNVGYAFINMINPLHIVPFYQAFNGKKKQEWLLVDIGHPSLLMRMVAMQCVITVVHQWYHVPRSFLRNDTNTLVLFEEIGGNLSLVNFQTISVGSACSFAYEGNPLELSCEDSTISAVKFASFGEPQGSCGSMVKDSCEAADSLSIIQQACIGKASYSIDVSEKTLGSTNCSNITRRLAVEVAC